MTRRKFQGVKKVSPYKTMPSEHIETATEAEVRLESLLRKLAAWLVQQPDWVFLLAQDRHVRRQTGAAVADMLTRIPQRRDPSGLAPGQVVIHEAEHPVLDADAYMDALEKSEAVETEDPALD